MSSIRALSSIALVAALGSLAQAAAADGLIGKPVFRVAPAAWLTTLDGEWQFTDGPVDGTSVKSKEVGLDDATLGAMIDGNIGLPWILDFEFGGYYFNTDGEKTLRNEVVFGEAVFPEGDRIKGEATLMDAYAGISFRIVDTPFVWLSLGATAHFMAGEVELSDGVQSDTYSESSPAPAVVARGAVSIIPSITIGVAAQGMSITVAEADIKLLDLQGYIEWKPLVALGVVAGYRMLDFSVDIKDDEPKLLDVNISGPYAGIVISL